MNVENPNKVIDEDTKSNLSTVDKESCVEWGGQWENDEPKLTWMDTGEDYSKKTVVRSGEDAIKAFEKYEEYFERVLEENEQKNNYAVLIPCGSQKPIGCSSIHKKKLNALEKSGLLEEADLYIMSEPCTIVPHNWRLRVPPVNYDFPPEYTVEEDYPQVFEKFVNNLVRFFEEYNYEKVFSYLVEGHQNKMDEAIKKVSTEQVRIPGASYNPETENCSGDYFKSTEDIVLKILATLDIKTKQDRLPKSTPQDVVEYYESYLDSH